MNNTLKAEAGSKIISFLTSIPVKLLMLAGLLYLFILSITLIGVSFKEMGGDFGKQLLQLTSNPIVGLFIGILATAVIQSSSTTTSIIVSLVGASSLASPDGATVSLSLQSAIPMVMGANVGTSITNTLVSLGHISRSDEFRRAFAGSTVHDFFNLLSVIVLLPLQIKFNIIGLSSQWVEHLFEGFGGMKFSSPLKIITKPVAKEIFHLAGSEALISIAIALLLLFIALRYIVKTLKSMVLANVERFFQRFVFRTPALGFLLGIVLTVMVQSSSITTSLVIPLVGAGIITLRQIFPYTLGANIGTTITAFLASFVTQSPTAVAVAFAHLMFNIYGIMIFWPLKRIPIALAEKLSDITQQSRLIPLAYIVITFFIIPGAVIYFMR